MQADCSLADNLNTIGYTSVLKGLLASVLVVLVAIILPKLVPRISGWRSGYPHVAQRRLPLQARPAMMNWLYGRSVKKELNQHEKLRGYYELARVSTAVGTIAS
jgi:hypothetical protein